MRISDWSSDVCSSDLDMRFLRNPHYVEALRRGTGQDAAVGDYIAQDANFSKALDAILGLLRLLVPAYRAEGKSYLTIAVGFTGGRHRRSESTRLNSSH